MIYTDTIIRTLYRSHREKKIELTPFQKRSRLNSVYRGVETLLEFRHENELGVPVYCPVLYDRKSCLIDYQGFFGGDLQGIDPNTPVIEVLNYIAPIPSSRRTSSAIAELMSTIHKSAIDTSLRKPSELELLDNEPGFGRPPPPPAVESKAEFLGTQQSLDIVNDSGGSKPELSIEQTGPSIGIALPGPAAESPSPSLEILHEAEDQIDEVRRLMVA